jgi:hypothetical protein
MLIHPQPKGKAEQIGDEALAVLNLPASTCFPQKEHADAYRILAQLLLAHKNHKKISEFLEKKQSTIVSITAKAKDAPETLTPQTVDAWMQWLHTIPEIAAAQAESTKTKEIHSAKATPLLNYFAALTKLLDTEALSKAENTQIIEIATLRADPPKLKGMAKGAVLAFALRTPAKTFKGKNSQPGYRILFTCKLEISDNGAASGLLQPAKDPDLILSQSEFFTEDGSPKGDFDGERIEEIFGKSWDPAQTSSWAAFMAELDERCLQLFGGPLHEFATQVFGNQSANLQALIIGEEDIQNGMWSDVFQKLKDGRLKSAAVDDALKGIEAPRTVSLTSSPRQEFLGQMDTQSDNDPTARAKAFPLDASQRLATIHAAVLGKPTNAEMPESRLLAINGPPGTGKTSFLRAVLASKWVQSALNRDALPPIVLGTGFTNKSVVNMIEAFGNVAGTQEASIQARWLEGLPSYGWFLPSEAAVDLFPNFMQLNWSYAPSAAAGKFSEQSLEEKRLTYLEKAKAALAIANGQEIGVATITDLVHQRMQTLVRQMHLDQDRFDKLLAQLPEIWQSATKLNDEKRQLEQTVKSLALQIADRASKLATLQEANKLAHTYIEEHAKYKTGWRSWLPHGIRSSLWESAILDLAQIERKCVAQCQRLGIQWATALPLAKKSLKEIQEQLEKHEEAFKNDQTTSHKHASRLVAIATAKSLRKNHVQSILEATHPAQSNLLGEMSSLRCIGEIGRGSKNSLQAQDTLLARHESLHDLNSRVQLFHLAARYWEGRWVLAETDEKKQTDIQSTLGRLMMLGVIIVATTHKYCLLGKKFTNNVKADLLIMDEAGQCPVEIAVGALAYTKTAIFVGDVQQLQPITTLSEERVERLAVSVGIEPNQLPKSLCYKRGSGMAMAQRASSIFDGVDAHGVTLLYHYRCHPLIIGYCNQLLYKGKIKAVRANVATPSNMPPMSWVQVDGNPQAVGKSWVNDEEIAAITKWISENHAELTQAYGGKPLDEILAIITPLAPQALKTKKFLLDHLPVGIDKNAIERMTIGTVHKLQGAERPVVLFSLVQNTQTNSVLFADKDDGYLMNVAVSRAKDSFVIFATRPTLNPAPSDAERAQKLKHTPINALGRYLRKNGKRLFPTALVVVEAKGKVAAIQRILGSKVKVIETNGNLCESRLIDGELHWTRKSEAFTNTLSEHAGLIDTIVMATDDDIAGELIGLHAAEILADIFPAQTQIKRMRFHSVTEEDIQLSYRLAGDKFDADYLAAALVREYARHIDHMKFSEALPESTYVSAQARDLVDICLKLENQATWTVQATLQDGSGNQYHAFIPESTATLSPPKTFAPEEAKEVSKEIADAIISGTVNYIGTTEIQQIPTLYPASTTHEILAAAATELNMLPWDAQAHLNAMYQEGAK